MSELIREKLDLEPIRVRAISTIALSYEFGITAGLAQLAKDNKHLKFDYEAIADFIMNGINNVPPIKRVTISAGYLHNGFYFHPRSPEDIVLPSEADFEEATSIFTDPEFINAVKRELIRNMGKDLERYAGKSTSRSLRATIHSELLAAASTDGQHKVLQGMADLYDSSTDPKYDISTLEVALINDFHLHPGNPQFRQYIPANFTAGHLDMTRLISLVTDKVTEFEGRTGKKVDRQRLDDTISNALKLKFSAVNELISENLYPNTSNPFYAALAVEGEVPPHSADVLNDYLVPQLVRNYTYNMPILVDTV